MTVIGLPVSQSLLLAQAVNHCRGRKWEDVARLMQQADPVLDRLAIPSQKRKYWTAEGCENAFKKLARGAGLSSEENQPLGRNARKLAHKLYGERMEELVGIITDFGTEIQRLEFEIDSIRSDKWTDEAILGSFIEPDRTRLESVVAKVPVPTKEDAIEEPMTVIEAQESAQELPERVPTPDPELANIDDLDAEFGLSDQVFDSDTLDRDVQILVTQSALQERATLTPEIQTMCNPSPAPSFTEDQEAQDDQEKTSEELEATPTPGLDKEEYKSKKRGNVVRRKGKRKTSEPVETEDNKKPKIEEGTEEDKETKAKKNQWKKAILLLLDQLTTHPKAHHFMTPVLKSQAPSYYLAIKRPVSLKEVIKNVREGKLERNEQVMADVARVCGNAVVFNKAGEVVDAAREVWAEFEELMMVKRSSEFV